MGSSITLAALVLASSLVGCMHHTTIIGSSAAPLLSACSGSYSCKQACHAGKVTLTETADADGGATNEVIGEDGSEVATWSGDSASFELCTSDGCLTCTNDAMKADAGSSSSSSGSSGGKCTGKVGVLGPGLHVEGVS